jgi:nitrous oxidase accessory protein
MNTLLLLNRGARTRACSVHTHVNAFGKRPAFASMRVYAPLLVIALCSAPAYASLQSLIDAAPPNQIVRVPPGSYTGNLVLNKPVTLEGTGRPVIRGEGKGSVITVSAPGCTIRGFVIEHSGGMLVDEDSGILLKSSGNRIESNELRDILFGVYLFSSSHNRATGNIIHGRESLDSGDRGAGIHIYDSVDNTIEDNTITFARDGMYLQNASDSAIRRNRVSQVRYGLHYMYSNNNVFEDNTFSNNVAGAAIMYSHDIQFSRNLFMHNRGFSSFGILFQDSERCTSRHNLIVDNAVGIFAEALRDSTFEENLISENDIAIEMFSSAGANQFTRNNFIRNLSPIKLIGKSTTNQWSRNGVGNYWSEYTGYDLDGDGIGDVPFKIQNLFEHLEGNYPRLRIYFDSPSAQVLAMAEQSFPVLEAARELDRHPLMKPVAIPVTAPGVARHGRLWVASIPLFLVVTSLVILFKETIRVRS